MSVTLQILNPCAQKWSDMTPVTATCRSCASCQRTVTDFTQKNDAEVLAFLQQHGRVCGRFRPDQLNRPLLAARKKRSGLTIIAASFATLLAAQHPAMNGQKAIVTDLEQAPVDTVPPPMLAGKVAVQDSFQTISGKVLAEDEPEGLIGAVVTLSGTNYGAMAGLDGIFSLRVPTAVLEKDGLSLEFSYTGYHGQSLPLSAFPLGKIPELQITLAIGELLLSGDVIFMRPTFKQRLHRFFHRHR